MIKAKPKTMESFIHAPERPTVGQPRVIKPVALRLSPELLDEVDRAVVNHRPYLSRNQWLLEAICEKLDREKANNGV